MCNIRDQRLWSSPNALATERRSALPPEREGSMHDISKLSSPPSPADGADRSMAGSIVDDAKETVSPTSGEGASKLDAALTDDVASVAKIDAVGSILEVVCRTTGMGFAAVARVTENRWIACSVRDEIAFGLQPGGELKVETTICHEILKVETTICHEIRQTREAVVINHVAEDDVYCRHPTPAMYGFQSYISMPIMLANGTFFGTLCAIDPRPTMLKTPE